MITRPSLLLVCRYEASVCSDGNHVFQKRPTFHPEIRIGLWTSQVWGGLNLNLPVFSFSFKIPDGPLSSSVCLLTDSESTSHVRSVWDASSGSADERDAPNIHLINLELREGSSEAARVSIHFKSTL